MRCTGTGSDDCCVAFDNGVCNNDLTCTEDLVIIMVPVCWALHLIIILVTVQELTSWESIVQVRTIDYLMVNIL